SASSPMAVLLEPDVLFSIARSPNALFSLAVLATSALRPCALLKVPSTLPNSAFVPKALLSEPLSLWTSALAPTAVFSEPVVLRNNAVAPTAVLLSTLLRASAPAPTPVLPLPVLFENSEYQPTPVFAAPVVRDFSELHPSAVVKLGEHPSGGGTTACTPGKNARADKIAPKMICRFCIGEFSPLMIWFAVKVIWFAVGPRPRSRAPPFVCRGLPIRFASAFTKLASDLSRKYAT